jgi:hypothetical protein
MRLWLEYMLLLLLTAALLALQLVALEKRLLAVLGLLHVGVLLYVVYRLLTPIDVSPERPWMTPTRLVLYISIMLINALWLAFPITAALYIDGDFRGEHTFVDNVFKRMGNHVGQEFRWRKGYLILTEVKSSHEDSDAGLPIVSGSAMSNSGSRVVVEGGSAVVVTASDLKIEYNVGLYLSNDCEMEFTVTNGSESTADILLTAAHANHSNPSESARDVRPRFVGHDAFGDVYVIYDWRGLTDEDSTRYPAPSFHSIREDNLPTALERHAVDDIFLEPGARVNILFSFGDFQEHYEWTEVVLPLRTRTGAETYVFVFENVPTGTAVDQGLIRYQDGRRRLYFRHPSP